MGIKTSYLLIMVSAFLLGCTKTDSVLFEIPFRLDFEIPAGLSQFEKHFFLVANVPNSIGVLKEQFKVGLNQKLQIRPASAIFTSLVQDLNFDFIEEVGISVYEGNNHDDDTDVFLTDFVPSNAGRNINILPFNDDVSDHIDRTTVNFKVSLRLRATTPFFIQSNVEVKFTAQ